MPEWATFAAFAGVVTAGLLLLSHASRGAVSHGDEPPCSESSRVPATGSGGPEAPPDESEPAVSDAERPATPAESDPEPPATSEAESPRNEDRSPARAGEAPDERAPARRTGLGRSADVDADARTDEADVRTDEADARANDAVARSDDELVLPKSGARYRPSPSAERPELSTTALLANVAVSQGAFAVVLLGGAWYAQIPAAAFGAGAGALSAWHLLLGVGLGTALYVANEVGAAVGGAYGVGDTEALRETLAPDSLGGWAALLFVVLPVIAGFEELLFRGALVGVVAAGFDVSPWLAAAVSSVAFALGHGAQGRVGVVVTGALGLVLAAAFVLTGSLLVVVVAHYLVNALEFVVHEGLGVEWTRRGPTRD